jgi:outer membrane receptor protein involved in Fe transport
VAVYLIVVALVAQFAPTDAGALRVVAIDATGGVLPGAAVTIDSDVSQTHRSLVTGADGVAAAMRLPFGTYRVTVALQGFTSSSALVTVRSAVPVDHRVTLAVAPLAIADTVTDRPLVDERQTTTVQRLGADTVQHRVASLPGRALPDLINTQPGWLLEAGGIVHPRGSENQTQYVVDGLPLTENRSPGFAPELDADAVQALGIMTGGYPAEYGRKLGGVIEVTTVGDPRRGFHGDAAIGGGSFATRSGEATAGYSGRAGSFAASASGAATDRYLDPPVEENYTNHGDTAQATIHAERGGLGVLVSHAGSRFLVPNETAQQEAGQIQRRDGAETAAKLSYQNVLSPSTMLSVSGMWRTLDANLSSNDAATPIFAEQQRGLTDGYAKATIAWHRGAHEWKAGADTSIGRLHEQFDYRITDPDAFDPGTLPSFAFAGRATDREHALFVQDQIAAGPWTVKAGLRWDAYHLVVDEHAFSPRLSAAWSPARGFTLRASYDRAFQTPAIENLLLASSPDVETLAPSVVRLPVRPSRGNFYEVAASKSVFGVARLDASWYDRRVSDFADDDLLLNTGVSFPIAFRHGYVHGAELKFEVPSGRRVSGFASYSFMRGVAELPVTGGLFLGDEVDLGSPGERVAISQDQRHTLRGRLMVQLPGHAWGAVAGAYDSGLPFEIAGDPASLEGEISPRVLAQVDFDAGRLRPSFTLDASAGWAVGRVGKSRVALQGDVRNLTDELRVINFAGVLSGTALAAPRSFAARVRFEF